MAEEDESLVVLPTEFNNNPTPPRRHQVNFPAFTWDYRVVNKGGPCGGFGLVATRNIKKGELVFSDSYEFMFADVQEGDVLRFDRYEKASRRSEKDIPPTFPLTRDVLTRSHGVPVLINKNKRDPSSNDNDNDNDGDDDDDDDDSHSLTITWRLEVPCMLANHSCDPNVIDDCHDAARGEAYAARDIQCGDELCYDYAFQSYDDGPCSFKCHCGAAKCRGSMIGFKALSNDEKQRLLPHVSDAVRALYEADFANGPPVTLEQSCFPPRRRSAAADSETAALPLVVPGPSYANADILIQRNHITKETAGENDYGLYAARDFHEGETVYEFWTQRWPTMEGSSMIPPVDMIFSSHLLKGDPPEGTVVRVHALECAKRDRDGQLMFSGWDLFTAHSCEPNLVYNDKGEDEDDDWHAAYAARFIRKGDQLLVDFNSIFWDRTTTTTTEWQGLLGQGSCSCGADKCRGTVKGFRFLSHEDQEELKSLSWRRNAPPHDGSKGRVIPGEALTPHVRVSWRQHSSDSAPGSLATSSSEESSSSEDEQEA
jgi:hypothetical protein